MNPSSPYSSSNSVAHPTVRDYQNHTRSTVSWGAIFAGTTAALALHVLFMMLGAGLGLAIYSPLAESDPVSNLSIGALIIHSIAAIISLCLGGWIAGRFSTAHARSTGWLHGFSVWCAATVGGVVLVALGVGAMMGGLSKIVGGGLSAVGQPVAAAAGGAGDILADAANRSEETISSFVEEAVGQAPEDRPTSENIRATREVGMALGRLFNPAREGDTSANRTDAVSALVEHTEMSQAEAERAVAEWTASYDRLQDDLAALQESAATQAREAGDAAASAVAKFSLWSFFAFLLGALAATLGGYLGAKCATSCDEETDAAIVSTHDRAAPAPRPVPEAVT